MAPLRCRRVSTKTRISTSLLRCPPGTAAGTAALRGAHILAPCDVTAQQGLVLQSKILESFDIFRTLDDARALSRSQEGVENAAGVIPQEQKLTSFTVLLYQDPPADAEIALLDGLHTALLMLLEAVGITAHGTASTSARRILGPPFVDALIVVVPHESALIAEPVGGLAGRSGCSARIPTGGLSARLGRRGCMLAGGLTSLCSAILCSAICCSAILCNLAGCWDILVGAASAAFETRRKRRRRRNLSFWRILIDSTFSGRLIQSRGHC
mmetsp:Transcript_22970/g.48836  ORF Transcript_22970/g.48836 Transcript_22970/m.48836 type:complete len:269 (-) Transcript_22970:63-869(-)